MVQFPAIINTNEHSVRNVSVLVVRIGSHAGGIKPRHPRICKSVTSCLLIRVESIDRVFRFIRWKDCVVEQAMRKIAHAPLGEHGKEQ